VRPDSGGFSQTDPILKTDKVTLVLERGRGGKFEAKSGSWDHNKTFLPGEQLRVEVVSSSQLALTRWRSEAKAKRLAAVAPVPPKAVAGGLGRRLQRRRSECNGVAPGKCNGVATLAPDGELHMSRIALHAGRK
jgi:hypothetical protein